VDKAGLAGLSHSRRGLGIPLVVSPSSSSGRRLSNHPTCVARRRALLPVAWSGPST